MAQAGFTPIQLYYSNTATNTPASLANGELAINQADGKLYYRNSSGVVTQFSPAVATVNTITFGSTGLTPNTATSGAVTVAGTLITSNGGTGLSSYTAGDTLYYASGTLLSKLAIGASGTIKTSTGTAPQWVASLSTTQGGTGLTTFTAGDLVYFSSGTTFTKLGIGTAGQYLTVNSGATAPQWATGISGGVSSISFGSTGLTPNTPTTGSVSVAGTLGAGYGGTSFSTYTSGDMIYASATNTLSKLNAGTNGYVLTVVSGLPAWAANTGGVTSFSAGTTGLTPSTVTTGAIVLSGTLIAGNGGTGLSTYAVGDMIYASATTPTISKLTIGTAGQVMVVNVGATAPSWAAQSTLTAGKATNIAGGAAGSLFYNTAADTSLALSIGTAYQILGVNAGATAPSWQGLSSLIDNSLTASAQGTVLYRGASSWVALAPGANGQVLTTGGSAANVSWTTAAGGLTGFTGALNTAAPNATNNVSSITASGGTTNQFAAIIPKGTGGIVGAIPDSAATGGNVRGTYSVDLQLSRSAATNVASGIDSSLIGGASNTASATDSTVVGGNNNQATGTASGVFAGTNNSTVGTGSVVIGGNYGSDRSAIGTMVMGANGSTVLGYQQYRLFVLMALTTGTSAVVLTSNGSAVSSTNQPNLTDGTAMAFRAHIVASVRTSGGDVKAWTVVGAIKRGAGVATTTLIGTPAVNIDASDSGAGASGGNWTVTVAADTTNGALSISCAGQNSVNIRWNAVVYCSETAAA